MDTTAPASEVQPSEAQAPRPPRRWLRFSLRTLLLALTLACVALGWWVHKAERQRRAVAAIRAAGGYVEYDYERDGRRRGLRNPTPPGPVWLHSVVGVDYFADVYEV